MSIVTIGSGGGSARTAGVDDGGRLLTQSEVGQVQSVVDPVVTRAEVMEASAGSALVGTSSAAAVAARSGRRWMELQNIGAFPIHILLANSGSATTDHRRLDPGEVFSPGNGACVDCAVQAIAAGGSARLTWVQLYVV